MPPLRIMDEGWERLPRIAMALAGRMVWRALPLMGADAWREQAQQVVAQGWDFSLGVQTNPFTMRQNARALRSETDGLSGDASEAAIRVREATARLAEGLVLAAEALVRGEDQVAIFELSGDIANEALKARKIAFNAMQDASDNEDDRGKVEAALRPEELALRRHRAKEIGRLGDPSEYDEAGIGPSFDPGPAGPLGALWPAGEPSWWERVSGPVVALAENLKDWGEAKVVAFYQREIGVQTFLARALAFTAEVLKSSPTGKIPPTPCVYIPDEYTGRDRAMVVGELVSAGAVALDDDDLNMPEPPHSAQQFAAAVEVLHHSMRQGPFRPWAEFAPTSLPELPPLSDKRWTRVPNATSSYDSIVQRSSGEVHGGWPTAD